MVTVMFTASAVTLIAVGETGAGVPAVPVVMAVGVDARLVLAEGVKVDVPPMDVTCNLKVAAFELVKTQVI
jgi:hypothetical protein